MKKFLLNLFSFFTSKTDIQSTLRDVLIAVVNIYTDKETDNKKQLKELSKQYGNDILLFALDVAEDELEEAINKTFRESQAKDLQHKIAALKIHLVRTKNKKVEIAHQITDKN